MSTPNWDERFAGEGFLYGTEPAPFVTKNAGSLPERSRVLSIADGEGRNSVWLAEQGADVTAMDASRVAIEKAQTFAAERGVIVAFNHGDVMSWPWDAAQYDVVLGVFFQFLPPKERAVVFQGLDRALRHGGTLMLHGFAPRQVEYGSGGPPHAENMYTLPLLREAFPSYSIAHEADYDAEIHSGAGHNGMAALIDFVAHKPG